MKKRISLIFVLAFTVICASCGSISGQGAQAPLTNNITNESSEASASVKEQEQETANEQSAGSSPEAAVSEPETEPAAESGSTDLYAMETYDSVPDFYLERHDDVDYGMIETDVEYESSTAGDRKYCNVLLPAGYDESKEYPVLYMIHGWGGQYDSHIYDGSTLQTLYGNMLSEGLAVPMIIVGVDMYTDILADKDDKTEEEMRLSYDKTVDDIPNDLMPFIEGRYSVKKGRLNTAVTGVSQGATTSLAAGFKWQSKIGYIGSFAPDPGVIPSPYYAGTYWNWPILDDFTIESSETMPRYIYLTVGTEDPWNIEVTAYYGEVMDKNGIPNQNDLVEGYGHDGDFWALAHYNFMQKVFLDSVMADVRPAETAEEAAEMLAMTIDDVPIEVHWEDNESVDALMELVKDAPLTIRMSMYSTFEQVGPLGTTLPRNDVQTTTEAGDIVLYSGNQIVVFYGANSWSYTRLGKIIDKSAEDMTELLGNGDVTITFSFGG